MTFIQSRVFARSLATALFALVAFFFISTQAFAAGVVVTADIPTFTVGEQKVYSVTTEVDETHENAGKMVRAYFTSPIEADVEYFENHPSVNDWKPLPNEYGPEDGFPLQDATSNFRATFDTTGTYVVTVELKEVGTGAVIDTTDLTFIVTSVAYVDSQSELEAAIANDLVTEIVLEDSFEVDAKILIDRPVIIDGNGFTISSNVADNTVWNSATAYIFQAYNATDVVIKDIKLTNANAGLLVNGSTVTLKGTIDVSGNGFGGVESSAGSVLTVSAATLVNDTEAYGLPTIWEDGVTGTTVEGFSTTGSTAVKSTQMQYYLGSEGVVRNEAQLNAALSNGAIAVITIGEDFDLTSDVDITRSVSIDGNDKTLFTIFEKTDNSNNSGLSITADNVDVKDLTIDGTDGTKLHGINVFLADSVTLSDVSLINNSYAGMVVNGSTVTVTNITTRDNVWGGINVDQGSDVTEVTTLTVNGTSAHTEAGYDIWRDSNAKTDVSVDDVNSQYDTVIFANNSVEGTGYTLKAPVQPSTGGGGGGRSSMRDRDQDEDEEIEVVEEEDETKGEVLGAATSTPTTTVAYYTFTVDFGIGSTGTDVTNLQTILMAAGFLDIDAPTGYFGQLTFAAVQKYQSAHMIPNTGFVGPLTRAQLNTTPIIGAAQTELIMKQIADLLAEVAKLQAELNEMLAQ